MLESRMKFFEEDLEDKKGKIDELKKELHELQGGNTSAEEELAKLRASNEEEEAGRNLKDAMKRRNV